MTAGARRHLRRGVVILPSAFTLGNLFLGTWAIVEASRGDFVAAGWLIVAAAFADMFDGRIARFTSTGSEFGEQLDSLVDAISFGVAPALLIYFRFLTGSPWGWVIAFIYICAAIIRLARFNVEQAGTAKVAFHGLPSPNAGVTLATFHTFTQTGLFAEFFPAASLERIAVWLTIGVAGLMISHVLYPVVPRFTIRTASGRLAFGLALASLIAAFTVPEYFFFGMAAFYILYGLTRTVILGFLDRLPDRDPLLDEEEDEGGMRPMDYDEIRPRRRRLRLPRVPRTPEDRL